MRPNFLARPASFTSEFLSCVSSRSVAFPLCPARLAPRQRVSAPPVKGVLRLLAETRKPFFRKTSFFLHLSCFSFENSRLVAKNFPKSGHRAAIFRSSNRKDVRPIPTYCVIPRPIPKTHRLCGEIRPESCHESRDTRPVRQIARQDSSRWSKKSRPGLTPRRPLKRSAFAASLAGAAPAAPEPQQGKPAVPPPTPCSA